MAGRFLVLSASMGAGHDAVASELIRRLRAAGDSALLIDVLDLLPPGVGPGLRGFYRNAIRHAPALYAGLYAAFFRTGDGPRPGSTPLAALAEKRLLRLVEGERPDAVVPVFHLAAQLTGRLRLRGALGVPSAVLVTDFAVHRQWLHPGNDLYLCLTRRTADDVHRMAERPAVACGPLVPDCFLGPAPGAGRWRRRLDGEGLPAVLISAGAWGAGTHFSRTARLVAAAGYRAVVLCGRNEALRRSLSRTPGVLAAGWVRDMPGLMAASRVLVDNAAGQTALEALAAGLPVVGYRPIPGHGAQGVRLMAEHGLACRARDPWGLVRSLDALSAPGPQRDMRVAAGKALFTGHPGAVPALEELAASAPR
ncbi:glycosyltransferase [Streptomyces sp. NPDC020403]|uniref:MGDG synthase family glycosyltransferase n=1 Tax=unclassified Streptomyces TaxID=2593676 RepID=UPI0033E7BE96